MSDLSTQIRKRREERRCDWCGKPGIAVYEGQGPYFWVCADHVDKAEADFYKRSTESPEEYEQRRGSPTQPNSSSENPSSSTSGDVAE